MDYAERCPRNKPMPGNGSSCILAIDSFMPKYKHGTARHGKAWAEWHASVLCCWAEETGQHGLKLDDIIKSFPGSKATLFEWLSILRLVRRAINTGPSRILSLCVLGHRERLNLVAHRMKR